VLSFFCFRETFTVVLNKLKGTYYAAYVFSQPKFCEASCTFSQLATPPAFAGIFVIRASDLLRLCPEGLLLNDRVQYVVALEGETKHPSMISQQIRREPTRLSKQES
jgi:hypothetical protein